MRTDCINLSAISPFDGRYRTRLEDVSGYFSEYALIRNRLIAEFQYYFFIPKILHKKLSQQTIQLSIGKLQKEGFV
jgi:hypothetical protein